MEIERYNMTLRIQQSVEVDAGHGWGLQYTKLLPCTVCARSKCTGGSLEWISNEIIISNQCLRGGQKVLVSSEDCVVVVGVRSMFGRKRDSST